MFAVGLSIGLLCPLATRADLSAINPHHCHRTGNDINRQDGRAV
jgi:hypothetical protein